LLKTDQHTVFDQREEKPGEKPDYSGKPLSVHHAKPPQRRGKQSWKQWIFGKRGSMRHRQKEGFPHFLPEFDLFDPFSDYATFNAEFTVTDCGWRWSLANVTLEGQISPWHDTTIEGLEVAFGHQKGTQIQVSWAYPDEDMNDVRYNNQIQLSAKMRFARTGAYLYRVKGLSKIIKVLGLAPASHDISNRFVTLRFGRPHEITLEQKKSVCRSMADITLDSLSKAGAIKYCWAFQDKLDYCDHGCWVYKLKNEKIIAFPLVVNRFPAKLGPFKLIDLAFDVDQFNVDHAELSWEMKSEGVAGRVSPFHDTTIPGLAEAYGFANSTQLQVAWAYPDEDKNEMYDASQSFSVVERFARTGAYVYIDKASKAVITLKGLAPASADVNADVTLKFGPPMRLTKDQKNSVCKSMNDITLQSLYDAGAKKYCWAFQDKIKGCDHGCFLYKLRVSGGEYFLGFPIVL